MLNHRTHLANSLNIANLWGLIVLEFPRLLVTEVFPERMHYRRQNWPNSLH